MKALGVLDRYVLKQWLATFTLSVVGIPAVAIMINLSDRLRTLTSKPGANMHDILLGQLYLFPYQMSLLFPAAVLFATVFTLNALGRNSELTAIKAGGISFFRLIAPMITLAIIAVPTNFGMQELAAFSSAEARHLQRDQIRTDLQQRSNAAFTSETGWTFGASLVKREPGRMQTPFFSHPLDRGQQINLTADSAIWWPSKQYWMLHDGLAYLGGDSGKATVFRFKSVVMAKVHDAPKALINEQKKAEEQSYRELGEYLEKLRRSDIEPGQLKVDYYLKIALPVACLVVALFGAPLSITSPRSGAALGLAMALGTTLIYLTGTQIMKAIGGKDIISPILAAWSMNMFFGVIAVILLFRVRS